VLQLNKYERQIRAFGEEVQDRLRDSLVCIVGLGGIGSQIAQALAYLGVESFILIDEDIVEGSNLNRLIGATAGDIGRKKVNVTADLILHTNTRATCKQIAKNLRSREALAEAQKASAVFGCVDNDGARLVLMELCCAYKLPYLDSATEFFLEVGRVSNFGGRVVVSRPGDFCLSCAGEIDMEMAKAQLEPEKTRKVREEHGYGFGPDVPSPAVVSLNGIIANIAVTEFLMMTSVIREPFRKSTYKGMRGVVQVSRDIRREGCFNCEYLVGQRDSANIFRYAFSE
jgi:molybdopterin-synthase adenylyltransferase